jgi:hypothetical protein
MIHILLSDVGSAASILGLLVSLYVLYREVIIEKDVTDLKNEEEAWHKEK